MNFTDLVMHGLSAMSVLGDRIGVRLLIAAGCLLVVAVTAVVGLAGSSISGLGEVSLGLFIAATALLLFAVQFIFGVTMFAFGVLGRRDTTSFLPVRDYNYFVDRCTVVWARGPG